MTKPAVPDVTTDHCASPKLARPHLTLVGSSDREKKAAPAADILPPHETMPEFEVDLDDMWDNVPV
ncbi:MAG: hypothetical protein AAGK71_14680 [Pseudomonadota bacterium]